MKSIEFLKNYHAYVADKKENIKDIEKVATIVEEVYANISCLPAVAYSEPAFRFSPGSIDYVGK